VPVARRRACSQPTGLWPYRYVQRSLASVRVCAACERENPPDARFCNWCGAVLSAGPAPRQRRKTVTVLFCDVVGSTALGERLDPETFREVMRRYFVVARRAIEDHGGTVEKFIGDAVMAVFGVPVLHEDDALRAVSAAAGLRDEIAVLNRELETDLGITVSVRVGVNTGQVVAGTGERLATGDAVNLAARLEQAAAPGEIVIGPQTWRIVRDVVSAEALGPLHLKGKSAPVAAYRLLRVDSGTDLRARRSGSPLVGRRGQLRLLSDAFARVVQERSCHRLTILGAAGVGKSRLTAEFLRGIDARVLTGRCLSYGQGVTYRPAVSIVKQLLESPHRCVGATALMASDTRVAGAVNVLIGEQAAVTSSAEIAWAVRKLFESSADLAPIIAVFDDLHWGEPALLDLIEHITGFSRSAPILVLCLARPELLDRQPGWSRSQPNATNLLLEPLTPTESAALIEELLRTGRLLDSEMDAQLRERVQVTAAGNPLFVEEMLALIIESDSRDLVVPPTIQALLAARLDQLRPEERTVLECGSVEGQSFHRGAVHVMAPEERDIAGPLVALTNKDLLRPDRAVLPGEDAFRFRHLLIRDAAYDALAKTDRAELHERFATWLQERGTGLVELDEIVGHHLELAFRYRSELGLPVARSLRLSAAAAHHLNLAGQRAMDRGDTGAAVNLLERAESLLPPQEINHALQQSLIRGLAESGRLDDAISRAERIADKCSAAGDRVGELTARLAGTIWQINIDPERRLAELRALVEEARTPIGQHGDAAARAALEHAAGYFDFYRCRNAAALTSFTRAMDYAREAGDLWFETSSRAMAAICIYMGPTPVSEALAWLDDAAARSATYQAQLYVRKASLLAGVGRFDEARQLLADTIAQLNERGLALLAAYAMQTAWRIEMLTGDDAAAERAARQGCEQLEQLGERSLLSTQACQLADALYALGRYQESEQSALHGMDLGSRDDLATQFLGLCVRSRLLARRGNLSGALALAEEADGLARTSDDPRDPGDAALNLAEIMYLAGDRARSDELIARATAHYERKGVTAYSARAQRLAVAWAAGSSLARIQGPGQVRPGAGHGLS
jgi:class 3 adenylate cyclase/predicted ATPase